MTYWDLNERLVSVLELFLRYHPAPFRVLTDPEFQPSTDEIAPMLEERAPREDLGVRVDGGAVIQEAERRILAVEWVEEVIRAVGGWPHLAFCVREYRDACPENWRLLRDHTAKVLQPGCEVRSGDGGRLLHLAADHGMKAETVIRRRAAIIRQIARSCLVQDPNSAFRLSS